MFRSRFSIHIHDQRKRRSSHFDIRIVNRDKSSLLSWAIPKQKFPESNDRVLAIQTPNHPMSYLDYEGVQDNGDIVTLFDRGECKILVYRNNLIVVHFLGKKIRGSYNFVKFQSSSKQTNWLIMKSKRV